MEMDQESYQQIADFIYSEHSPVGIDARKTHIYIIDLLQKIESRLTALEQKIEQTGR